MKKLLILFIMLFVLAFSVSAWHCSDTDQTYPGYTPWGDNALLGGTSLGWTDGTMYDGCTGTYSNANCQDYCVGYDLVEFYCDERPGYPSETIIKWKVYEDSAECGYEVPEFGVVAAGIAMIGALAIFIVRRRH